MGQASSLDLGLGLGLDKLGGGCCAPMETSDPPKNHPMAKKPQSPPSISASSISRVLCELASVDEAERVEDILMFGGGVGHINHLGEEGVSPLHVAVVYSSYNTVRILIFHGADLHLKSSDGRTAFSFAQDNDDSEMLQLLHLLEAQQTSGRASHRGPRPGLGLGVPSPAAGGGARRGSGAAAHAAGSPDELPMYQWQTGPPLDAHPGPPQDGLARGQSRGLQPAAARPPAVWEGGLPAQPHLQAGGGGAVPPSSLGRAPLPPPAQSPGVGHAPLLGPGETEV